MIILAFIALLLILSYYGDDSEMENFDYPTKPLSYYLDKREEKENDKTNTNT